MSVKDFIEGVNSSDEKVEANLSTCFNLFGEQNNSGF